MKTLTHKQLMASFSLRRGYLGCCILTILWLVMLWSWLNLFSSKWSNYVQFINSNGSKILSKIKIADSILFSPNVTAEIWNNASPFEQVQHQRKFILKEACKKKSVQHPLLYQVLSHSLYSKTYNFSVCFIYKCGYSSWLAAFLMMENIYTWKDHERNLTRGSRAIRLGKIHFSIKQVFQNDQLLILKKWNESIKVITVRNPFSRLLSAYNDKFRLHSEGRTYDYAKMGRAIEKVCRQLRHDVAERRRIYKTPRLEDFINYLVHFTPEQQDPHWNLYHTTCFPCHADFDFIIKFETLQSDMANLTQMLGLLPHHKITIFPHHSYKTTDAKVKAAFQDLPKSLVKLLYKKYKFDFEIFGYKQPSWLD